MAKVTGKKLRRAAALSATALLVLSGCGAGSSNTEGNTAGTIDYWLWDTGQLPGYQKCADMFQEKTGKSVTITQYGWDDYWQKLTAGFIADQGPDVFTNHASKYPQYVDLEVIKPLDEIEATKNVDFDAFQDGLTDIWTGPDGHLYGMPKDWDTIAAFYNKKMIEDAGYTQEDLDSWDFNTMDGGTFEKIIAHLTIDKNGVRGDEEGFDKTKVAVYGLGISESGGSTMGQGQWSGFTASAGWQVTNNPTWGDRYQLDDPVLAETIDWYFGLVDKGYMPAYGVFNQSEGAAPQLTSGAAAITFNGAWMITTYAKANFEVGTAQFPTNTETGKSMSMMNGLADSITQNTDDPEGSAEWVAFMASEQCQSQIGKEGVVFPSRSDATTIAAQAYKEMGIDTKAFTDPVERQDVFYFPITSFGADVAALSTSSFEDIYANRKPAGPVLEELNRSINNMFENSSK